MKFGLRWIGKAASVVGRVVDGVRAAVQIIKGKKSEEGK
jgi:hypothetical protein